MTWADQRMQQFFLEMKNRWGRASWQLQKGAQPKLLQNRHSGKVNHYVQQTSKALKIWKHPCYRMQKTPVRHGADNRVTGLKSVHKSHWISGSSISSHLCTVWGETLDLTPGSAEIQGWKQGKDECTHKKLWDTQLHRRKALSLYVLLVGAQAD